VIGIIAIFHVMISQFAVGGGLYLPWPSARPSAWPTRAAFGVARPARQPLPFFLILTGVFGTISGVGIWFAIGLTHPRLPAR